jgi:hypothetical protein
MEHNHQRRPTNVEGKSSKAGRHRACVGQPRVAGKSARCRFDFCSRAKFKLIQQENDMRFPLRQLICVAAAGAMALGVQAQSTPSTPPSGMQNPPSSTSGTPLNSDNPNAQAQGDYQTAIKACSAMTGTDRASCMRDARDARNRTMGTGRSGGDSSSSGGGAAGGASGGAGTGGSSGAGGASGSSGGAGAGGASGGSGSGGPGGAK